jgi:hypothetical protein
LGEVLMQGRRKRKEEIFKEREGCLYEHERKGESQREKEPSQARTDPRK